MPSLECLIGVLGHAQARVGATPNQVSAKENALIVREADGNKTICLVRRSDDGTQLKIEWVGDWKETSVAGRSRELGSSSAPWADAALKAHAISLLEQIELTSSALRALLQLNQLPEAHFLQHIAGISQLLGKLSALEARSEAVPVD